MKATILNGIGETNIIYQAISDELANRGYNINVGSVIDQFRLS